MSCKIFLASSSPQRRRILTALGFRFSIIHPQIDESVTENETPREYVTRLAVDKVRKGLTLLPDGTKDAIVIGADTCVAIDDCIFGKPCHREEARDMLQKLSDRVHEVHSAVAVSRGTHEQSMCDSTRVHFVRLSQQQLTRYLRDGEYENRAGAYAIQGQAAQFVSRLDGSYSSVIGLPVSLTMQLLKNVGMPVPDEQFANTDLQKEFPLTRSWGGEYCI
ncbi:MAG: Maf family protein [Acidiferrobacterales bacterium]|nr:Maf family protein [Acidiferrobacterales bacterium]